MKNIRRVLFICFICLLTTVQAQSIKGIVLNKQTQAPVQYPQVYLKQQLIGKLGDSSGAFTLPITLESLQDTLVISCLGFANIYMPVAKLDTLKADTFQLQSMTFELPETRVRPKTGKRYKLGEWKKRRSIGAGIRYAGGVAQQYIFSNTPYYLNKVRFYIMDYQAPYTLRLRLHIYKSIVVKRQSVPGEDLLHQNVIINLTEPNRWYEIDLTPYHLLLHDKAFYVSLEVINETFFDTDKTWINFGANFYRNRHRTLNLRGPDKNVPYGWARITVNGDFHAGYDYKIGVEVMK